MDEQLRKAPNGVNGVSAQPYSNSDGGPGNGQYLGGNAAPNTVPVGGSAQPTVGVSGQWNQTEGTGKGGEVFTGSITSGTKPVNSGAAPTLSPSVGVNGQWNQADGSAAGTGYNGGGQVSDYSAQIEAMFEAQQRAREQELLDAYNQSLEQLNYARDQINPTYFAQGNDLAAQYERTRRMNNMRADMNGLNTGAASQMDLAQQSNYLDAFGQIRAGQAKAVADADREIANLGVSYRSAVAQALADNDYQKATALLQEYQRRDSAAEEMRRYNQQQALADAQNRAAYGDFGGYAAIYGQETADAMYQFWLQSNPDYAWANGLIDAKTYKKLTGRNPPNGSTARTKIVYRTKGEGEGDGDDDSKTREEWDGITGGGA